jgi:hypothetical protein
MTGRWRILVPALAVWLGCTLLGVLLIDRDSGPSLLSLPNRHGVSLLDAVGAALLLAGWAAAVRKARREGWPRFRAAGRLSAAVLPAVVAGLLTAALVPDFGGRKFVVAGFLLLLEAAAAARVLRAPAAPGAGRPRGSAPRGCR